jgi:glycosyltransferase involved in cell wall biosynthesis
LRILYYNWVPLFDSLKRGGGVRIYQEGLIQRALEEGHQVTYFSAGVRYNLLRKGLRAVRSTRHPGSASIREFEIINSPIMSPSYHQFGREPSKEELAAYCSFLIEFINENGPFDVFHLNNAEGIPFSLFYDRSCLKIGKVVISLHNYQLLCQQVNLWHAERVACTNYQHGRRCLRCVTPPSRLEVLAACTFHDLIAGAVDEGSKAHGFLFHIYSRVKGVARRMLHAKRRLARSLSRPAISVEPPRTEMNAAMFRRHRHEAVAMVNSGIDVATAVSHRVAEIFLSAGVSPSKLEVKYIATNFASSFSRQAAKHRAVRRSEVSSGRLHIAFLGYARRDKGFFFLLAALAALPAQAKRRIKVTLAARGVGQHANLIEKSLRGFAGRRVIDGYAHSELKSLLDDIDLGIVPVVWEDCLPQVAYEFVGNNVPILAANMGGAPELVGPAEFIFKAGDCADFAKRLTSILGSPLSLQKFWDNDRIPMIDWKTHWRDLMSIYSATSGRDVEEKAKAET